MIIGIDEVGRGCLAGPLCVAAVAWPDDALMAGLADSKKLTRKKREVMAVHIRQYAAAIGIGWASPAEIDQLGLSAALRLAVRRAYYQLPYLNAQIIIDGREKLLGDIPATYIIKADATVPAVMAASIIAKVARDNYMHTIAPLFKEYAFDSHVGYATAVHRQALLRVGPCSLHRQSFAPVKELLA